MAEDEEEKGGILGRRGGEPKNLLVTAHLLRQQQRERDNKTFDTPAKAYAEAERRIRGAQRSGAPDLDVQLRYLETIPPSVAGLTALRTLWLTGTQVGDLAPLAGLTALRSLWLDGTRVGELAPLAGLTALRTLWLTGTQVGELAPLAGLTALRSLWLDGTRVGELAPLAGLTALQSLGLSQTQVGDLAPLAGLTALQSLWLTGTRVGDLAPLAGLTALQTLSLTGTRVGELAPLAGLTALQSLWLDNTRVGELAPLAGLTALQSLSLTGTRVGELAPLAGLTALQTLWLTGTQVGDLAPLAGLTALAAAAQKDKEPTSAGLHATGTPVARRAPFDRLLALTQPAATVETINYLRRSQGLAEFIPEGYQRPDGFEPPEPPVAPEPAPAPKPEAPLPDPESIPPQTRGALRFGGPADGPVRLEAAPDDTPHDTPAQREFYDEIKHKAGALIGACGASNRLGRVRDMASRLTVAMGAGLPELQERLFWSRMNSLRRMAEIDRRARAERDPETPAMPEEVGGALDDLVDTLNVFASGDPRLVEMDEQALDPALRLASFELTNIAHKMADAARDAPWAVDRDAADVLAEQAADAVGETPSAARAKAFSVKSSRNLALELIRRAYRVVREVAITVPGWVAGATAGAVVGGAGSGAFADFVARHEPLIRALIRDLPAQDTLNRIIDLILRL